MSQVLTRQSILSAAPRRSWTPTHKQTIRLKSTSPYGRSHLRKEPSIPAPLVPHFKQRVILSDGSTFTHFTTSPRSVIRLTRDLTNNPFWAPGNDSGSLGEEESGRMGRFRKRFEGTSVEEGEAGEKNLAFDETMEHAPVVEQSNAVKMAAKMNLGGKYKAGKFDGDDKKKGGAKKK